MLIRRVKRDKNKSQYMYNNNLDIQSFTKRFGLKQTHSLPLSGFEPLKPFAVYFVALPYP